MDEISRKVLSKLHEGRNVVSNLSRDLGMSEEEVRDALVRLEEKGAVESLGGGLYGVSEEDPNSNSSSDNPDVSDHEIRQAYAVLVRNSSVDSLSPDDVAVENWANKIGVTSERMIEILSKAED